HEVSPAPALGFERETQAKEALILRRCSPTGKANHLVLGKAPLVDGLAYLCHEPAIKGHVVQRQQRGPEHLSRQEEVMQVGPAEMAARVARTTGLDRSGISLEARVAQPQGAIERKRGGIAAIPGR